MSTAATFEQFDNFENMREGPDENTENRIDQLKRLREKRGEKPAVMPNLQLEELELKDKSESIFKKIWGGVKETFDFLVVKPADWVWEKIKDNPIKTILIALAAFGLWYFAAPLSAGLSGITETGMKGLRKILGGAISIDPPIVNNFDMIMNPGLEFGGVPTI